MRVAVVVGKLLVTVSLLYWVLSQVSLPESPVNWGWMIFAAAALLFTGLLAGALRFCTLLSLQTDEFGYRSALKITLIGHLFNQVLPSAIGGDVIRLMAVRGALGSLGRATGVVVYDRLLGLAVLLVGVIIVSPLTVSFIGVSAWVAAALSASAVVSLALALWLAPRLIRYFRLARLEPLFGLTRALLDEPPAIATTVACSAFIHASFFVLVAVDAALSHVPLSVLEVVAVIPAVLLVTNLPISIGGWGVREAGLVGAFQLLDRPPEVAVAIGISIGIGNLLAGLPGAWFWLRQRRLF